ncbi:MAG: VanW family protein, partial [Marmoricola sp.]|nr:VanW family protein [Marmoricola sp.]
MADNLGARVAGLTVLGLFVLAAAAWGGLYLYAGDHAPRNARVEGISIAGLGPDEAEQRLRDGLRERVREPIGITYGDGRSTSVDPAEAGLSVDYAASVREAGGGSGFGLRRMWAVATGGEDRRAEITVDQSRMQPALDALDSGIARPPTEGTVTFCDCRATAVLGRPGLVVNRAATQALLERRFLHGGSQKVPTETRQPAVSD